LEFLRSFRFSWDATFTVSTERRGQPHGKENQSVHSAV
jgi:hypothetical protein